MRGNLNWDLKEEKEPVLKLQGKESSRQTNFKNFDDYFFPYKLRMLKEYKSVYM